MTCTQHPTHITYHRHIVAISGMEYGVPPQGRTTSAHRLPKIVTVQARANHLGAGSDLVSTIAQHWHLHLAPLGQTSDAHLLGGAIGMRNRSRKVNEFYAVFRSTHVYTGTFANRCGGQTVTGTYTTFGFVTNVLVGCGDPATDEVERVGHRICT